MASGAKHTKLALIQDLMPKAEPHVLRNLVSNHYAFNNKLDGILYNRSCPCTVRTCGILT